MDWEIRPQIELKKFHPRAARVDGQMAFEASQIVTISWKKFNMMWFMICEIMGPNIISMVFSIFFTFHTLQKLTNIPFDSYFF